MALRILGGMVNITSDGPKNGRVAIGFNPHDLVDGDAALAERTTLGPAGRFTAVPLKMVALRQITLIGTFPMGDYRFRVNDEITRDDLVISWHGDGPAFSEEISYLVIGEVPDPPRGRRPARRAARPARAKPSRAKRR
jgi:hypothetical protein